MSEFPQDKHKLVIAIEDGEHEDHEVVFIADSANSRLDCSALSTFGLSRPDWRRGLTQVLMELEGQ